MIENRNIYSLTPYARNSRTHSKEQVLAIAASIEEFGFAGVVVVRDGVIAKGHGTVAAATLIYKAGRRIYPAPGKAFAGVQPFPEFTLPVIDASGWTDAQFRAFIVADNQLALSAGWDEDLLRGELEDLLGDGFDLGLLGFSDDELSDLLEGAGETLASAVDPDDAPDVEEAVVSKLGDVWVLGDHRLVCGDCTDPLAVAAALNGSVPHLMVTDPPYGVEYDASWRNDRVQKKGPGAWVRATGKVMNDDKGDWREAWALFPGDVAYVWHSIPGIIWTWDGLSACRFDIRNHIIWAKGNLVISKGHYHSQHESCFYAVRKGATAHWNGGRKQTTVWKNIDKELDEGEEVYVRRESAEVLYAISGNESTVWDIKKPAKSVTGHSTQKPVECMRRPIANNSKPGDRVYDPFVGSGTTIIACEMTRRACHAIELNPAYVDVAVRRWQEFTGRDATLESTGQTFSVVMQACRQRAAGSHDEQWGDGQESRR